MKHIALQTLQKQYLCHFWGRTGRFLARPTPLLRCVVTYWYIDTAVLCYAPVLCYATVPWTHCYMVCKLGTSRAPVPRFSARQPSLQHTPTTSYLVIALEARQRNRGSRVATWAFGLQMNQRGIASSGANLALYYAWPTLIAVILVELLHNHGQQCCHLVAQWKEKVQCKHHNRCRVVLLHILATNARSRSGRLWHDHHI